MATIAENLQKIVNIKQDIKTAIENKGVDMTNTPFSDYSTKIDEITTGGGTGKIDIAAVGIKLGNSTFTEIPNIIDFSNVTDMSYMFYNCTNLTTIPELNTSNVTTMYYMFVNCSSLTTIPELDTSNVTTMYYTFYGCNRLTTIPELDTSKVKNMHYMFYACTNLTTIPELDCGSVTNTTAPMGNTNLSKLTELGGFKNLKVSWTSSFLDRIPKASVDSLMNVINGLWDWTDYPDGKAPLNNGTIYNFGTTHSLKFGSTNLNKLTAEQIAVATAKGWTLT